MEAEHGPCALSRLRHDSGFALASYAPTTLVPFPVMNRAFNLAARLSGDGQFGARIGQMIHIDDFGSFVEYALHARTLRNFILRLIAALPLHNSESLTELRIVGGRAFWRLRYLSNAEPTLEHHAQRSLVLMLKAVRRYTVAGTSDIELHVAEPHAPEARGLERLLGISVRPRTNEYGLIFPSAWLDVSLPIAGVPADMSAEAMTVYLDHPLPRAMADAVMAALALDDDLPAVGVGNTAAAIGLPSRTLQHALQREGISYRDILRGMRIRRAQQLLATTEQPLAEVSLRAGYTDASNFHRAFVKLTGMTPGRFREQSTANRSNVA